jgi:hypothetical protein
MNLPGTLIGTATFSRFIIAYACFGTDMRHHGCQWAQRNGLNAPASGCWFGRPLVFFLRI